VDVGIVVTGSGDPAVVESGGLLVEAGAVVVGGVGWAVVWWLADGALVVCPCWLHPYSNNPTSILAAAIWTFCIDFTFIIPLS
jgi:hypothetical protein